MFNRMNLFRWAPIPLRLIVGYGFMEHSYAKLLKGPMAFASILHALNVPSPHLMASLTILTELIGGFAVFVGAFVPLVDVPIGCSSSGRDFHCPSALRLQFDQADGDYADWS